MRATGAVETTGRLMDAVRLVSGFSLSAANTRAVDGSYRLVSMRD